MLAVRSRSTVRASASWTFTSSEKSVIQYSMARQVKTVHQFGGSVQYVPELD